VSAAHRTPLGQLSGGAGNVHPERSEPADDIQAAHSRRVDNVTVIDEAQVRQLSLTERRQLASLLEAIDGPVQREPAQRGPAQRDRTGLTLTRTWPTRRCVVSGGWP